MINAIGNHEQAEERTRALLGAEDPDPTQDRPQEDELLIDGQEEVFSRAEIERGVIEHQADT